MSTASQHSQNVQSRSGEDRSTTTRLERATEFCVEDHPTSAALVTFLSGVGAGFVLTTLLLGEKKRRENVAERLGHQVLEYIHDVVPRSVSDRLNR